MQTLPAACAAGNYAIGFALDQIRAGRADVVITGASEILDKVQFAGFVRLGAIAPEHCQPFDKNRKGLLIGEGAAHPGARVRRACSSGAGPTCWPR